MPLHSSEFERFDAAFAPFQQGSVPTIESDATNVAPDQQIPWKRRVKTVTFTPPARDTATPPVRDTYVSPTRSARPRAAVSALSGKPLRYLIGADSAGLGHDYDVTVVSYSASEPVKRGVSIAYCNLFDETNSRRYGPYLQTSDTAVEYNEGQIDPAGPGWTKNLREQFERRRKQGFEYVELDNADAYTVSDVIGAIELAGSYGLKVIAKNPGLLGGGARTYVAHPNVYGIIVERGAGTPDAMDVLRRKAGKPEIPVWFIAFGAGRGWADGIAKAAKNYWGMGVTYSSAGEYGNVIDILWPVDSPRSARR